MDPHTKWSKMCHPSHTKRPKFGQEWPKLVKMARILTPDTKMANMRPVCKNHENFIPLFKTEFYPLYKKLYFRHTENNFFENSVSKFLKNLQKCFRAVLQWLNITCISNKTQIFFLYFSNLSRRGGGVLGRTHNLSARKNIFYGGETFFRTI